jgi:hypothetical protein
MRHSPNTTAQPDLRSEYGLACPKCGQAQLLKIAISSNASVTAQGVDSGVHLFWDDDNRCRCPVCEFIGTVADFSVPDAKTAVNAVHLRDDLVEALELALDALNTAPRFHVRDTDSYDIASRVSAVLAKSKGGAQ